MADRSDAPRGRGFLKDISGTTIALTSLAVLGAAAVVTTPVWLWYRRKRKRTDALLRSAARPPATAQPAPPAEAAPGDTKASTGDASNRG